MKKFFIIALFLCGGLITFAQNLKPFTVEGPEDRYNMVRLINETSQDTINCRVVLLDDNGENKEIFGVYSLNGKQDHDSKVKWVNRGTKLAVEMPKDFPTEVSIAVEYVDRPVWDFILIHINDAGKF